MVALSRARELLSPVTLSYACPELGEGSKGTRARQMPSSDMYTCPADVHICRIQKVNPPANQQGGKNIEKTEEVLPMC